MCNNVIYILIFLIQNGPLILITIKVLMTFIHDLDKNFKECVL